MRGRADFQTIHQSTQAELKEGWAKLSKILEYLVSVLPGQAFIDSSDDLNATNILVPVVAHRAPRREIRYR